MPLWAGSFCFWKLFGNIENKDNFNVLTACMNKETIKIFIASSAELEQDRKAFRECLSLLNDRLHYKGQYLELVQWEYFFNAVSQTGKQDDYNQELKKCDIVICLFYKKAGKYTQLEFDTALKQFHETGAPLIYTYFKEPEHPEPEGDEADPNAERNKKDLADFKLRLKEINHFYTRYINIDNLKIQFLQQLDMLKDQGYEKLQEKVKEETKEAVTQYINTLSVTGNNNVVIQGVTAENITVNVNGNTEEIRNELGAMRAILEKLNLKSFQADDKVYDINGIDSSNFAYVLGRAGKKKILPVGLKNNLLSEEGDYWIESLRQVLDEESVQTGETADTIFTHFGWLIEAYLLKFVSIQDEGPTLRRLSFLAEAYQSSLRFLCFVQLSQLLQLELKVQHPVINDFIRHDKDRMLSFDYSNLLIVTTGLLKDNGPFMPEINKFVKELSDARSDLYSTNLFLEDVRNKILGKSFNENENFQGLIDEYLTAMVEWLSKLTFLSRYKMVSIKEISLEYRLGTDVRFGHVFGELNGVYEEAEVSEGRNTRISIKGAYTFNQSILLLKGQNIAQSLAGIGEKGTYISLSPLVIDQSIYAGDPKQTPEIYFFNGFDEAKRLYNYSRYRNELPISDAEISTNKYLEVRKINKQPALNTLYKCLDDLLEPFKSQDQ